ncbi:MAG TPA: CDP-alcohol phosphatidyltransferase family protein [Candidatus Dormibacteraeota bacterium]|jgi:cardiolipin synthase
MADRPRFAGVANLVTGSRIVLAVPGYWFGLTPSGLPWLAVVVAVAGLSDLVDGTIARRFDRPTKFGAALDPVADGFFYGAVAAGLAVGGVYPFWLAWVVIARYTVPALVGGLLVLLRKLPALRHTFFGQLSTALIAVLLGGLALFRFLGLPTVSLLLAAEVVIPVVSLLAWIELGWTARALSQSDGG